MIPPKYAYLLSSMSIAAAVAVGAGCGKKDTHSYGRFAPAEESHVVYADVPVAAPVTKAAAEMATAANAFVASLDDDQRKQATFEFDSPERVNWHFIPRERKGLPLKAMKLDQQELAKALLKTGLSAEGIAKSDSIRGLESILREVENDPVKRDPEKYFFSIFGKPDAGGTWGWRFEGHHQSYNFTLVDGKSISGGPAFMGTNPHEVRVGPKKGLRVLADEEDKGRALVDTLSDDQKKQAVFTTEVPKEIVTGVARQAQIEGNKGIAYADLDNAQKEQLVGLIELYAHRLRNELADQDLAKIRTAGLEKVKFAWAGSLEKGKGHYYRLQGPTFLVEYDCTQNEANHVHTIWRDITGHDFGDDVLKGHYEASKGDKAHGHDEAK